MSCLPKHLALTFAWQGHFAGYPDPALVKGDAQNVARAYDHFVVFYACHSSQLPGKFLNGQLASCPPRLVPLGAADPNGLFQKMIRVPFFMFPQLRILIAARQTKNVLFNFVTQAQTCSIRILSIRRCRASLRLLWIQKEPLRSVPRPRTTYRLRNSTTMPDHQSDLFGNSGHPATQPGTSSHQGHTSGRDMFQMAWPEEPTPQEWCLAFSSRSGFGVSIVV